MSLDSVAFTHNNLTLMGQVLNGRSRGEVYEWLSTTTGLPGSRFDSRYASYNYSLVHNVILLTTYYGQDALDLLVQRGRENPDQVARGNGCAPN